GSQWKSIVAAIVLVLLLAAAVTMALGPLDHTHPLARLLGIGKPAENQVAKGPADQTNPAEQAKVADMDHSKTAVSGAANDNSKPPGADSASTQPIVGALNSAAQPSAPTGEKSTADNGPAPQAPLPDNHQDVTPPANPAVNNVATSENSVEGHQGSAPDAN